jgi:hypothetical protein
MIQRLLYKVLQIGIDHINHDHSILEELFMEQYGLSREETAAIVKLWTAKPPSLIHGYARADSTFPVYAITLQGERESDKFIGDSAGDIQDIADPDFPAEMLSALWRHDYVVWIYTEHPDATLYYYEIAKHILLTASDEQDGQGPNLFVQNAVMDIDVSGQDMSPDPRYLPDHLFVRQLRFSCKREFLRVDRGSRLGKAFKVAGIHVDSTGSSSDVGGVKTLVTVVPT